MSAQSDAQTIADALRLLEEELSATPPNLVDCRRQLTGLHILLDRGLMLHGATLGLSPADISEIRGGGTNKGED